jgi:hypothetical protein
MPRSLVPIVHCTVRPGALRRTPRPFFDVLARADTAVRSCTVQPTVMSESVCTHHDISVQPYAHTRVYAPRPRARRGAGAGAMLTLSH